MRTRAATTRRATWVVLIIAIGLGLGVGPAAATPAVNEAGDAVRPVTIVLVRDLTWRTAPSSLDGFAKANVSMRNAAPRSGAEDTYVTLGKGNRSASLPDDAGVGRVQATSDGGLRLLDWQRLKDRDAGLHFGGPLGTVGEALRTSGRRWAIATDDKGAAAVAANTEGVVPRAYPGTADGIRNAIQTQPDAIVVAVPASRLTATLEQLDATCTLVLSASTPGDNRHLGVLAASPLCGLGAAGLASPSTHQRHLATLPDVSATFLTLAGVTPTAALGGAALTPTVAIERVALVERDSRSWTADRARTGFVWLFIVLHAVGAIAAIRMPRSRPVVCATLLSVPAASFLMMSIPWWRVGPAAGILLGGILTAAIAVGGALLIRRDAGLGVAVLATLTAAVVGIDAMFASPLQIDAPFGNSPIGAGRFFGVGNIGSGFLVAGVLVAGGLAIERCGRRAIHWVALALVMATVAGGAPQFGADVGGVLFAVPAYGVLLIGAVRPRITARHVALLGGATVVAIALFAAVDLVREAGSQTHLAKGIGGPGLGDEVIRKATMAIRTVVMPMAVLVAIGAAVLLSTRVSLGPRPALRVASTALLTAAILGSLLNDSGAIVAAAVFAIAWPAAVALASESRHQARAAAGL